MKRRLLIIGIAAVLGLAVSVALAIAAAGGGGRPAAPPCPSRGSGPPERCSSTRRVVRSTGTTRSAGRWCSASASARSSGSRWSAAEPPKGNSFLASSGSRNEPGGAMQVTYNGKRLYTFTMDTGEGHGGQLPRCVRRPVVHVARRATRQGLELTQLIRVRRVPVPRLPRALT